MESHGCKNCGPLPLLSFYMNRGKPMGECKECVKARVRKHHANNRVKRSEYERRRMQSPQRKKDRTAACRRHRQRHPLRYKARSMVANAVARGVLKREPCSGCGTTHRVQAHHADYSKPLEVTWACFRCHRQEHGQVAVALDDGRGSVATG